MGLSGRSVEGLDHVEAERAITDGQWKGESWRVKNVITEGLQESCFSKPIRTVSGRVRCLRGFLIGTPSSSVLWVPCYKLSSKVAYY